MKLLTIERWRRALKSHGLLSSVACLCLPVRWLLRLHGQLMAIAAAVLLPVLSAQACVLVPQWPKKVVVLPPIGGSGGSQFTYPCSDGLLLTGFSLLTGNDVDAIRPICVVATGPVETSFGFAWPLDPAPETTFPFMGKTLSGRPLTCPRNAPIVTGMHVRSEGERTVIVNNIHLWCGVAAAAQTFSEYPNVVFDGPTTAPAGPAGTQFCPAGLVAVGIHGKSGIWLDSVGLVCGEPTLKAKPPEPKALGRVTLPLADATKPPRYICEAARDARARNSPAAPGLEAQCRAAGAAGEPPPKALGRVTLPGTEAAPAVSICQRSRDARARNSPAAPGLEAQCRAAGPAGETPIDENQLAELAEKGAVLTNEDPLAIELRNRQLDDASRRGFDVGMAAAEGETAPGPGKDRTRDSLPPEERGGFITAVAFSLERNKNAALAATGAAIVAQDPLLQAARNGDPDVFSWLGFDIATGIFGDPALGAKGNTATGPGSLKIRDSLGAAGQRGFNAAVTFHLSQKYSP